MTKLRLIFKTKTKERQLIMKKKTIKELRKENGMTQKQLAEKMGVNIRSVQRWEADKSYMSRQTRQMLLMLFKTDEGKVDF